MVSEEAVAIVADDGILSELWSIVKTLDLVQKYHA